jgi:DNA polymerase-1
MRVPPRKKKEVFDKEKHTLLIDSNSLFKLGFNGRKNEFNTDGIHVGGITHFIISLRNILNENSFDRIIAFWDGEKSGKLKSNLYKDYKIKRNRDYKKGNKIQDKYEEFEINVIKSIMSDLCIRQFDNDGFCEADDLIGFYCSNKADNEKITILTSDRDLCQLVDKDIRVYLIDRKKYVTTNTFKYNSRSDKVNIFNFHYKNVALVKVMCGDASDSIRGVKGLGMKKLLSLFPFMSERECTIEDILNEAKKIKKEREDSGKKPIKIIDYIIEGVTTDFDGNTIKMGMDLYERNMKIIDLKNAMVTSNDIRKINDLKTMIFENENGDLKEVYRKLKKIGIDRKISNFGDDFLIPFKKIIKKEKKLITN